MEQVNCLVDTLEELTIDNEADQHYQPYPPLRGVKWFHTIKRYIFVNDPHLCPLLPWRRSAQNLKK